jgi:hypothetical protein
MKKLLVLAALLLMPLFAAADDVKTLLAPNGTLYTVEMEEEAATEKTESALRLVLTTRRGSNVTREVVPATYADGAHANATLAYDAHSGILYIFWLHHTGTLQNKLMFASVDAEGIWSEATTFGQPFDYRENLSIAVTRDVVTSEGTVETGITVHATWWEMDTHDGEESAKYAILALENGKVAEINYLDLGQFITAANGAQKPALTTEELAVLRQPVISLSSKQDSVLVTFGDIERERLHRVRVSAFKPPKSDGRIRIPVGKREGGTGAPRFGAAAHSTMGAVQGDHDRLAFYVRDEQKIHYVLLRGGEWSESREIALDGQLTAADAIDAIRRLVNEQ